MPCGRELPSLGSNQVLRRGRPSRLSLFLVLIDTSFGRPPGGTIKNSPLLTSSATSQLPVSRILYQSGRSGRRRPAADRNNACHCCLLPFPPRPTSMAPATQRAADGRTKRQLTHPDVCVDTIGYTVYVVTAVFDVCVDTIGCTVYVVTALFDVCVDTIGYIVYVVTADCLK